MSGHPTQSYAEDEWKARYRDLKADYDSVNEQLIKMIETNESLSRLCGEITEARDHYKAELDARDT